MVHPVSSARPKLRIAQVVLLWETMWEHWVLNSALFFPDLGMGVVRLRTSSSISLFLSALMRKDLFGFLSAEICQLTSLEGRT